MFTMRLQGGAPIYEQLEQRITDLIVSGEMAENEKLPAVREIAKQLSINPNTVQKTYANLEARGLIYSIPAKGSYVAARENYIERVRGDSLKGFSDSVEKALKCGISAEKLHVQIDEISKNPEKESDSGD
ncbi:MAG: GntR family transcriptional regulator [Oscillospiraceae bacterium]|nr:GntR family transcriptional regulator [Oscillospiraceae bacterium]